MLPIAYTLHIEVILTVSGRVHDRRPPCLEVVCKTSEDRRDAFV